MSFTVTYSSLRDPKSLKRIGKSDLHAIMEAIEEKLTVAPDVFGKPLRHSMRGYRSLRVVDFRVLFRIDGSIVRIACIGHRSTIYRDAQE